MMKKMTIMTVIITNLMIMSITWLIMRWCYDVETMETRIKMIKMSGYGPDMQGSIDRGRGGGGGTQGIGLWYGDANKITCLLRDIVRTHTSYLQLNSIHCTLAIRAVVDTLASRVRSFPHSPPLTFTGLPGWLEGGLFEQHIGNPINMLDVRLS